MRSDQRLYGAQPSSRLPASAAGVVAGVLVIVGLLAVGYIVIQSGSASLANARTPEPLTGSVPEIIAGPASDSTTTTAAVFSPTTTAVPSPPVLPAYQTRYVVRSTEVVPEAKQLAADIAFLLTTYEESEDRIGRLFAITDYEDIDVLARASEPLTYPDSWSRGEVVYPQLGGLTEDRASVMVITRQTVGSGSDPLFSVVRTLDIRLVLGESGWEFESLDSAGGTFDTLEDLTLAHEIAADPRIQMPDSARLDIRDGLVSPTLLRVMSELADRTPFTVAVLTTGHPYNVFETDRMSHHTSGRAVDIIGIGDRLVIDDRGSRSTTRAVVEWLFEHPDVVQVGSPWDLDGETPRRSFTDAVHQDHLHLAVVEDP